MRAIVFSLLLVISLLAHTQVGETIHLITRPQGNDIMLRWAPANSLAWELGNKYGYTVERFTVLRDSALLNPREYSVLAPVVLLPAVAGEWEPIIDDNDFAAVVAQAVYGETFELSENFDKDVFQVAQKTQERDQRFSFALFACDQDFQVAQMAGLGIVDYNVEPGEKYLYRVFANIPEATLPMDSAVAYVGLTDVAPLPEIAEFRADFGDQGAILSWNKSMTDRFYNAFIVEKSSDGGSTYQSITDKPIINTYTGIEDTDTYFKMDTLQSNDVTYQYRVFGLNPFGEKGPPSQVVSGKGMPTIDALPGIVRHELNPDGSAVIFWKYPKNKESLINGFILESAPVQEGGYTTITTAPLNVGSRSYRIANPRSTGYYRIGLATDDRIVNQSFPYLIQLEDSIAPLPPQKFTTDIDTLGRVGISWEPNTEDDLWGYRIYRSNFKNAEFSEITSNPIVDPVYYDTLSLENLTEKMYYKVIAVDRRDNRSGHSEILVLDKPDRIPPASPIFSRAEARAEGAFMSWNASSSSDLVGYKVFRGVPGTAQWELIARLDTTTTYVDSLAIPGKARIYTVVAYDDAGLESAPAKPMRISRKFPLVEVSFKRFSGRADRDNKRIVLFWKLEGEQVKEIKVYRSQGELQMSLYQTIAVAEQFVDTRVQQNQLYRYKLRAVLEDGRETGLVEPIEITY